jgi:putative N6-adenine-specific DNA methylase
MNAALEKRIKRQIIGKQHRFLAVSPLGFEQTLVRELEYIKQENSQEGALSRHPETQSVEGSSATSSANQPHVTGDGKVEFTAKITEAWKIVAFSRIANRVLMEVASFKAENFRELEKKASEIPWELYLPDDKCVGRASRPCLHEHDRVQHLGLERSDNPKTSNVILSKAKDPVKYTNKLNIHVTCKHSRLYHSDAIAERLYNVIGRSLSHESNLYVNFLDDRCTIWLDLAGEELYKRGHERFVNDAPLKETIAAAMLFEAFDATAQATNNVTPDPVPGPPYTLLDLMSGSGTFSLEAAYIANKLIPGVCRDFALKHQPAFKEATWNFITRSVTLSETKGPVKSCKAFAAIGKILTSDISERAVNIIKHNIESCPLANISPAPIIPQIRDFFSYTAKEIADACGDSSPVLVLNPPYGKRLDFDAPKLYTKIGKKLTELANGLAAFNKRLTVAILAPKDDTRDGSKYTCTANLLRECPAISPERNPSAKIITTSHGGLSLNALVATI